MAGNRRKKNYRQNLRRGAAILAVTTLCCGLLRLTGNAIHQMWREVSGKTVVYAADGRVEQEDWAEQETGIQESLQEQKTDIPEETEVQAEKGGAGTKLEEEAAGKEKDKKEKTMYLTFDDGPTAENTVAVLDTLKEKNVKATFFVVGENVEKHPEVAAYLADFEKAYQMVYEVTGVKAQMFRFPGGSVNAYNKGVYKDIIAAMTERGYTYFDWNASLEDAVTKSTPESLLVNAKETALGRKKVVMLCHDTVYNTTLCLGELIDQFPEYQMEPLTPEVAPIQFK